MMADLIAEALQEGFCVFTLHTSPETCGVAMEVPEIMLYSEGFLPFGTSDVSSPIHAARMFTPGAAISGYKERKHVLFSVELG